jgi:hypothetical protein
MSDVINAIFENVRQHMSGGKCPTPGCLGECAIIAPIYEARDNSERTVYFAACYMWDTEFNDSALLASWFQEAGAKGVTVSHVLFDEDNGDRDGKAGDMGDVRAWHVHFVIERAENASQPDINECPSCKRMFRDGETCSRGGCPMGGDV